jgi:hypothetical protein
MIPSSPANSSPDALSQAQGSTRTESSRYPNAPNQPAAGVLSTTSKRRKLDMAVEALFSPANKEPSLIELLIYQQQQQQQAHENQRELMRLQQVHEDKLRAREDQDRREAREEQAKQQQQQSQQFMAMLTMMFARREP